MRKGYANPNHPPKGSTIKVEPIRETAAIERIKQSLRDRPRDRCLFVLGINTGYRANELLSITCGQVAHLRPGDVLDLWQRKTRKHRAITLNYAAIAAVQSWLAHHPAPCTGAPLFLSRRGRALTVSTVTNMVKRWCAEAGLSGNYGSHTLRKTWGFHQLRRNTEAKPQMVLPILMHAYGHASQEQTLDFLCIQSDEMARLFMQVEL